MSDQSTPAVRVRVRFEAQLRELVPENPLPLSHSGPASVLQILGNVPRDSAVRDRLFDADGTFRSSVLLFVNERPVAAGAAAETPVADGDEILVFPPISGG